MVFRVQTHTLTLKHNQISNWIANFLLILFFCWISLNKVHIQRQIIEQKVDKGESMPLINIDLLFSLTFNDIFRFKLKWFNSTLNTMDNRWDVAFDIWVRFKPSWRTGGGRRVIGMIDDWMPSPCHWYWYWTEFWCNRESWRLYREIIWIIWNYGFVLLPLTLPCSHMLFKYTNIAHKLF